MTAMGRFNEIQSWPSDKDDICRRIRDRVATLKIVVKAKDEKHFLKDWIEYHSAMVGSENLIVIDNMSSDPAVKAIYEQFPEQTTLIRYGDFHNNIHDKGIFADLYAALKLSCRYFLFIDADEFVTFIGDDKVVSPHLVVPFLADCEPIDVYPGTWLYDAPLSKSLFYARSMNELEDGLRWGKPIVRSHADTSGILLHNSQLQARIYNSSTPLFFFILHMSNLYPDQRIAVNLRKMVARGLISPSDTVQTVLARDWSGVDDNIVKVYVSELKTFSETSISAPSFGENGFIRIEPNSRVGFPTSYEEKLFDAFRTTGADGAITRVLMT